MFILNFQLYALLSQIKTVNIYFCLPLRCVFLLCDLPYIKDLEVVGFEIYLLIMQLYKYFSRKSISVKSAKLQHRVRRQISWSEYLMDDVKADFTSNAFSEDLDEHWKVATFGVTNARLGLS